MSKHRRPSKRATRPDAESVRSPMIPGHPADQSGFSWRSLTDRCRSWYANVGPIWRFGLKFGALMALYYILVLTPFCDRLLYVYLGANAWLANGILNWFGQDSHVSGITIRSARFAITVRRGCDAIEPSWFFCAALFAFPAPFVRKLLGIVAGAVLLHALNLLRIVSLYFIGSYYPALFSPAHVEVWPAVFIIVAIGLWIVWIRWARPMDQLASHGAA